MDGWDSEEENPASGVGVGAGTDAAADGTANPKVD